MPLSIKHFSIHLVQSKDCPLSKILRTQPWLPLADLYFSDVSILRTLLWILLNMPRGHPGMPGAR